MKTISIVIPVYNHLNFLEKCITSVLKQQNDSIEVICVNDNSSNPKIKNFLEKIKKEFPIVSIIHNDFNLGISKSTNIAVSFSNGEFIGFLDCDDYLASDAINVMEEMFRAHPEIDYFFSDRYDINKNNKILRLAKYGGYPTIKPSGSIKHDLLDGMVASHFKVIRKAKIIEVGGFDNFLNGVQDWDLALKISEIGKFYYIQKPLYYYRIHEDSVTTSDVTGQLRKTNIVRRKFYERWYKKRLEENYLINEFSSKIINNSSVENINSHKWIRLLFPDQLQYQYIKELTRKGIRLILDARCEYNLDVVAFLREFNSFFDLIIVSDYRMYSAIIGYAWKPDLITLVH